MDKVSGLSNGIHQKHVIQGLLTITILTGVIAMFFHVERQLWQMVIINLVMLGYCLAFLVRLKHTVHLHVWSLGYVLLFVIVTLDAFYITRFQAGSSVWIILFPARALHRVVGPQGVHGIYRLTFNASGRFESLVRVA